MENGQNLLEQVETLNSIAWGARSFSWFLRSARVAEICHCSCVLFTNICCQLLYRVWRGIVRFRKEHYVIFKNQKNHIRISSFHLLRFSLPKLKIMTGKESVYKLNFNKEFDPQPPVYAVLTDLKEFYFFCYDGVELTCCNMVTVFSVHVSWTWYLEEMVEGDNLLLWKRRFHFIILTVTEILFSVLLQAYISTLETVHNWSIKQGNAGNVHIIFCEFFYKSDVQHIVQTSVQSSTVPAQLPSSFWIVLQ